MTPAYSVTSLVYAATDGGRHRPASHPVYGGTRQVSARPARPLDGRWIRLRRIALGMSQQSLANALGVTRPAVSWWESGGHPPNADSQERLERLLGPMR